VARKKRKSHRYTWACPCEVAGEYYNQGKLKKTRYRVPRTAVTGAFFLPPPPPGFLPQIHQVFALDTLHHPPSSHYNAQKLSQQSGFDYGGFIRPTGRDIFEQATGGTSGNATSEDSPPAFSRGQGAGVLSAERFLFLFLCYGPKAIKLPDTPASGVWKPGLGANPAGHPHVCPEVYSSEAWIPPTCRVCG
jgi:hypothetical protein